jgi:hypothetical protein
MEAVGIFQQYGWPGLIAVIIVTAIIIFLKYYKKNEKATQESITNMGVTLGDVLSKKLAEQNESIVDMISQQNSKLVSTLQDTNGKLIEHILNIRDKKHVESLEYRRDISGQIIDIMKELSAITQATRVAILEFHNTNINLSGLGFLSYDMKYERQELGVPSINHLINNRDISQLNWISNKIMNTEDKNKRVFILNLSNEDEKQTLYNEAPVLYDDFINKFNVLQVSFVGLYDYNTLKMLGILVIEYNNKHIEQIKYINKNKDEVIEKFAIFGSRISQLLTLPENIKN